MFAGFQSMLITCYDVARCSSLWIFDSLVRLVEMQRTCSDAAMCSCLCLQY